MNWKFRGYDIVGNKGWVYGDLAHNQKVTKTGLEPRTMVGGYEVAPESVSLWTGRKDCNNKEIYAGDIIKVYYGDKCVFEATVIWYEDSLQFMLDEGDRCYSPFIPLKCDMDIRYEVVGSVYERDHPKKEDGSILDKKLAHCGLSIRALCICKHNDIKTLRDLTNISRVEFLNFRNSGQRTLNELDCLLNQYNLNWKSL